MSAPLSDCSALDILSALNFKPVSDQCLLLLEWWKARLQSAADGNIGRVRVTAHKRGSVLLNWLGGHM